MGEDAPELGSVALHFDERSAELGLLRSLRECLLEQAAKSVLLALNPEDVLNFLPGTSARNLDGQQQAAHDLVAREPARACEVLEVGRMRVRKPHRDPMFQISHSASIGMAITLSRQNVQSHGRISRRR